MADRFQVIPAAYLLLRRDDQVLLQLRRNTGYMDGHWAMAAGHIERGESALEAMVREAAEELSIGVTANDLEPLCTMHRTQPGPRVDGERVDFFFQCRTWTGTPVVAEPEKSAGIDWFDLDRLPDPVVPHEAMVMAAVVDGLIPPIMTHGF